MAVIYAPGKSKQDRYLDIAKTLFSDLSRVRAPMEEEEPQQPVAPGGVPPAGPEYYGPTAPGVESPDPWMTAPSVANDPTLQDPGILEGMFKSTLGMTGSLGPTLSNLFSGLFR